MSCIRIAVGIEMGERRGSNGKYCYVNGSGL